MDWRTDWQVDWHMDYWLVDWRMDWKVDEVLVCPQNSMKTKRHFEPHPRWQMSDCTICQNQLQQSKQLTSNHLLAGSLSPLRNNTWWCNLAIITRTTTLMFWLSQLNSQLKRLISEGTNGWPRTAADKEQLQLQESMALIKIWKTARGRGRKDKLSCRKTATDSYLTVLHKALLHWAALPHCLTADI